MATTTQLHRPLSVTSSLGSDALLLTGFCGREEMSRLFCYQLDMVSEQEAIAARDIVGKRITWGVRCGDDEPRHFNGVVSRLSGGGRNLRNLRSYRAEVVPWLWFLTRTADCRIFQNQAAPDIIRGIFDGLGFSDYEAALRRSYPKREYCVQYRETAFNFVSRLMEQEGIFYFFRHEENRHVLVLADDKTAYQECPESRVKYRPGMLAPGLVCSWDHQYAFRPGKWAQSDYNFETPSTSLLTTVNTVVDLPDVGKFEMFDYPGEYRVKSEGDARTKVRIEEDEVPYDVATGASGCCTFSPGGKFTVEEHAVNGEAGKGYVLTSVQHLATDNSLKGSAAGPQYSNTFTCIPDTVPFHGARLTPKPIVPGLQTAVVVGPAGEEIYTDKYGRVKVQFFWDRKGKKDENSSCWIRVAQNWAGKNWGIIFNPRIGQEVVVEFLEGDPDRPLITGRVYNGEQMPPYDLPTNQTQSVIKTRSTKNGGTENFNELRFEDKKDKEEIYFHAEKDFGRVVENNDTLKVGSPKADDGSQTIEVYKDRTETVKTGNEKVTIEQGNRTVKIAMGNDALTISMGNQTTKIELGKSETEAMQSIELKVGQSSVKVDQMGVTISGMMIKIEGQVQTQVKGLITQINADALLKTQGGITMIG